LVKKAVEEETAGESRDADALPAGLQPFLHDACVTLYAPSLAISRPDGDLTAGVDGFFHGDRRLLSRLEVRVEGVPLVPIGSRLRAADEFGFRAILRGLGEHTADPAVSLHRVRRLTPGVLHEELRVVNAGISTVDFRLVVRAAADLATMTEVKGGRPRPPRPVTADDGALTWSGDGVTVRLRPEDGDPELDAERGEVRYDVTLAPGAAWQTTLTCTVRDEEPDLFPAAARDGVPWGRVTVRSRDHRLDHLLDRSLGDLERLLLTDPQDPRDLFLAAGAPWFLTLFGRDSLWAARMLLPLGTSLAAGTLRTLARRQGSAVDRLTEEAPGKILHEVRRATQVFGDSFALPPSYYGTVDATPLWVILLHDAWRWGLDPHEVADLLPHAEAALEWLATYGDADGDGLLEYIDTTGRGLANQGWKDSGDSIRWRDGRLAEPPIVLCEVQAYAYEAAVAGAALLRAFDRPGADRWQEWAQRLRTRFREAFWVEDARGRYPAVALDADKRPVDAVTSGFGHLLGTGLLDAEESALLAARLVAPDLASGFGLRTLSTDSTGFNPYGYHIGSVWPHDTAIAVHGLIRAGFPNEAATLARGLVAASPAFDGRLPELFSGHSAEQDTLPAPYPASCRPQAWAAAAGVQLLRCALGLDADVPAGVLRVDPAASFDLAPLRVDGLSVAGAPLSVEVDAAGRVSVDTTAALTVEGARPRA
jgi:glycogen debranching enzyme